MYYWLKNVHLLTTGAHFDEFLHVLGHIKLSVSFVFQNINGAAYATMPVTRLFAVAVKADGIPFFGFHLITSELIEESCYGNR